MDGINLISSPTTRGQINLRSIQEYVKAEPTPAKKEAEQADQHEVSEKQVSQAIDRANKSLKSSNTDLHIELHDETNRKIVQIKNQLNGETVREFPSKEFVKWEAEFTRWLGLLLDKKV